MQESDTPRDEDAGAPVARQAEAASQAAEARTPQQLQALLEGACRQVRALAADLGDARRELGSLKAQMNKVQGYIQRESLAQEAMLAAHLLRVLARGAILQTPFRLPWRVVRQRESGGELTDLDAVFFVPDALGAGLEHQNRAENAARKLRQTAGHLVVLEAKHGPTREQVDLKMRQMARLWDETLAPACRVPDEQLDGLGAARAWVAWVRRERLHRTRFQGFITLVFGYGQADPEVLRYIRLINAGIDPQDYERAALAMARQSLAFAALMAASNDSRALPPDCRRELRRLRYAGLGLDEFRRIVDAGEVSRHAHTAVDCALLAAGHAVGFAELAPLFARFRGRLGHLHAGTGAYAGPFA